MNEKKGHRFLVKIRWNCQNWYPTQMTSDGHGSSGRKPVLQTEKNANRFTGATTFDLICSSPDLPALHKMIERLVTEDHGEQGEHDGIGRRWTYDVLSVERMDTVRL